MASTNANPEWENSGRASEESGTFENTSTPTMTTTEDEKVLSSEENPTQTPDGDDDDKQCSSPIIVEDKQCSSSPIGTSEDFIERTSSFSPPPTVQDEKKNDELRNETEETTIVFASDSDELVVAGTTTLLQNKSEDKKKKKDVVLSTKSVYFEDEDHPKKKNRDMEEDEEQAMSENDEMYNALLKKDEQIAKLQQDFDELHQLVQLTLLNNGNSTKSARRSSSMCMDSEDDNLFAIGRRNSSSIRREDRPVLDPVQSARMSARISAFEKGYKDDPYRRILSRDTFSILVFSPPHTSAFWWSMAIFSIQMLSFMLVAIDIIDLDSPSNPIGMPANVEFAVRITQLLAIIISVATQEDIRTALNMMYDGYSESAFGVFSGSSRVMWTVSVVCRFLEGALGLVVTFFLIMTEDTVIDLLLNFTAMEFVSHLDEIAFYLSRQGFLGKKNQLRTETVLTTEYYIERSTRRLLRICMLVFILLSMIFGWIFALRQQQKGAYLCSLVFVQFSDDFVPALGTFSGIYVREDTAKGLRSSRPIYVEERSGQGSFQHCDTLGAWTFGYESRSDPCADWVAISEETSSFDLVETSQLQWFVLSEQFSGLVPLQYFQMSCYDCEGPTITMDTVCAGRGSCVDNHCFCNDESFGLQCEFTKPCYKVAIDETFGGFIGNREWSEEYVALKDDAGEFLTAYDRPVYISEIEDGIGGSFDVLLFTGRRWILTYSFIMPGLQGTGLENLTEFLVDFHAHFSDYASAFTSSPVDVGRPSNTATPIQKDWFRSSPKGLEPGIQAVNENFPLETSLLCGECATSGLCFFNSTCTDDGFCECTTGAKGIQCQIAPVNNGRCDEFFNTLEFDFDGGDCCESTCVSNGRNFCGKDEKGFIDIGYPLCSEPGNQWGVNGEIIRSDIGQFGDTGRAVALSQNGAILAVSEPGYDVVRVFDKDGSKWVQRGRTLEWPNEAHFGVRLDISSMDSAVWNPESTTSFIMAASGDSFTALYKCSATGCRPFSDFLPGSSTLPGGVPFALSASGSYILHPVNGAYAKYQLYRITGDQFQPLGPTITDILLNPFGRRRANRDGGRDLAIYQKEQSGRYLGVSADGNTVVIGSVQYTITDGSETIGILLIMVYDKSPISDGWILNNFFGSSSHLFGNEENTPLQSLALSADGRVLAIASKFTMDNDSSDFVSGVQVYERNEEVERQWDVRGLITGESNGDDTVFAWGVDISFDGSVLVVSSNGNKAVSTTCTFKWNGTTYEQHLNKMPGGVETAVAMSGDGTAVAIGLPVDVSGGEVLVHGSISRCTSNENSFRLSVTTDASPADTRWDVVDGLGNILIQGGHHRADATFTSFVDEICVDLSRECIEFSIYDDVQGNGIVSPGGYGIAIDGKVVAQGGSFGSAERIKFGTCAKSSCKEGESELSVLMHAVENLDGVHWTVEDAQGQTVSNGGPYDVETALEDVCAPSSDDECLFFAVAGGYCETLLPGARELNYTLFINGVVQAENSFYLNCGERVEIGNCSTTVVPLEEPLVCDEGSKLLRVDVFYTYPPFPGSAWKIQQSVDEIILMEGKDYKFTDFGKHFIEQACIPNDAECLVFSSVHRLGYSIQYGDTIVLSGTVEGEFKAQLDETERCEGFVSVEPTQSPNSTEAPVP